MSNKEKLQNLIQDVFLLEPSEFRFDLKRADVETWDSFGVVSLAVGVQETFGYHFTPEEASGIDVNMSLFATNDELFAKLRAGNPGFDVIVPGSEFV
jgi:acyl carrier protein